jgi:TolA-binding protein
MKSNLNLFLVAAFTLVAAACSSGSSDWDDMMDNQSGGSTASGGSSSSSSTPTTAGDLTTFDIAVDSTALTETETVPSDNEDYIENNTFSSVINIKYSGTSATVSGTQTA